MAGLKIGHYKRLGPTVRNEGGAPAADNLKQCAMEGAVSVEILRFAQVTNSWAVFASHNFSALFSFLPFAARMFPARIGAPGILGCPSIFCIWL